MPKRSRNQLEKVKLGEFLVFYIKKDKKIAGIFRTVSKPFESEEKIFDTSWYYTEETFSDRVRLEPILIPQAPIAFEKLIPKLKFITNKEKWGTHLMGWAMRTIPEEDYETIWLCMKRI